MRINPFKPNSPVPTGMFAGRYQEIDSLEQGLHQTKHGHSTNFLVTGERGIGKSSLMMCLDYIAKGDVINNCDKFDFVSISIVLSPKITLVTLIKLIERKLNRELSKIESFRSFIKDTWSFAQRLKVMDSGIEQSDIDADDDILIDEFSYSLSETCNRLINPKKGESKKDGIVFFIDEADNVADELRIGYFFKVVTELLQKNGCSNIMFMLAGLPDAAEKLSKSHESSIRLFHHLKIRELIPEDRKYVIERGLESGNEINAEKTTISEDAKNSISTLSEGYPHFIQQIAYSAFEHNDDGEISKQDVTESAFKSGGAIDSIGSRYYESSFHDKIKSDEYRQVLSIMADKMNSWIKKSEIRVQFEGDDTTLTNALQALASRRIILKNPSKMGEYRLQHRGFAIWIKLFGGRKK